MENNQDEGRGWVPALQTATGFPFLGGPSSLLPRTERERRVPLTTPQPGAAWSRRQASWVADRMYPTTELPEHSPSSKIAPISNDNSELCSASHGYTARAFRLVTLRKERDRHKLTRRGTKGEKPHLPTTAHVPGLISMTLMGQPPPEK